VSEVKEYRQGRFQRPPGATEIFLVRHGESAPLREGETFPLAGGHGDPPLDPVGHRQAIAVADRLEAEDLSAIYVSTLQRTAQTAAPLVERRGIEPKVEPDVREVFLGEWEGELFRKYAAERHPLVIKSYTDQRWDVIPGAEPAEAFTARVRGAIESIAARHRDECVAVFTHGGVIAETLAIASGSRPFAFLGADNGSISHIVIADNRWVVRRYNDTSHIHMRLSIAAEPII
jgi:probable phosphoglycerate mutase